MTSPPPSSPPSGLFLRLRLALLLPLALLPAASRGPDYRAIADDLIDEINAARADPARFAADLRRYRSWYRGTVVWFSGRPGGLQTQEGVAAVDEAIAFLERQPPLPPLARSPLLAAAAGDHVRDQGESGAIGHIGPGGARVDTRMKRRGGDIYVAESLTYGPGTARDALRQFVIDDNVKGRGHRKMMFGTRWRYAGAACGPHPKYVNMCAVNMGETADGSPVVPGRRE